MQAYVLMRSWACASGKCEYSENKTIQSDHIKCGINNQNQPSQSEKFIEQRNACGKSRRGKIFKIERVPGKKPRLEDYPSFELRVSVPTAFFLVIETGIVSNSAKLPESFSVISQFLKFQCIMSPYQPFALEVELELLISPISTYDAVQRRVKHGAEVLSDFDRRPHNLRVVDNGTIGTSH